MVGQIVVTQLSIHVETGPTCYPDEGGYSSISAEVTTGDENLVEMLNNAMRECRAVTLRCAMLDVVGHVAKISPELDLQKIVVTVDDLVYRKPARA